MITPTVLNTPTVLKISPTFIMISPTVLKMSPTVLMISPMVLNTPTVLITPHGTAHTYSASQEEQKRFKKRKNLALVSICLSVCTSLQIYVRTVQSAKEAWENLQKHFEEKSLSCKIFYRRKLYSARMAKGTDMIKNTC